MLPSAYQYRLIQLLPECDRVMSSDGLLRLVWNWFNVFFVIDDVDCSNENFKKGSFLKSSSIDFHFQYLLGMFDFVSTDKKDYPYFVKKIMSSFLNEP
jgi:hypothetical protein